MDTTSGSTRPQRRASKRAAAAAASTSNNPSKSLRPLTYAQERDRKRRKQQDEQLQLERESNPTARDKGKQRQAEDTESPRQTRTRKRKSDQMEDSAPNASPVKELPARRGRASARKSRSGDDGGGAVSGRGASRDESPFKADAHCDESSTSPRKTMHEDDANDDSGLPNPDAAGVGDSVQSSKSRHSSENSGQSGQHKPAEDVANQQAADEDDAEIVTATKAESATAAPSPSYPHLNDPGQEGTEDVNAERDGDGAEGEVGSGGSGSDRGVCVPLNVDDRASRLDAASASEEGSDTLPGPVATASDSSAIAREKRDDDGADLKDKALEPVGGEAASGLQAVNMRHITEGAAARTPELQQECSESNSVVGIIDASGSAPAVAEVASSPSPATGGQIASCNTDGGEHVPEAAQIASDADKSPQVHNEADSLASSQVNGSRAVESEEALISSSTGSEDAAGHDAVLRRPRILCPATPDSTPNNVASHKEVSGKRMDNDDQEPTVKAYVSVSSDAQQEDDDAGQSSSARPANSHVNQGGEGGKAADDRRSGVVAGNDAADQHESIESAPAMPLTLSQIIEKDAIMSSASSSSVADSIKVSQQAPGLSLHRNRLQPVLSSSSSLSIQGTQPMAQAVLPSSSISSNDGCANLHLRTSTEDAFRLSPLSSSPLYEASRPRRGDVHDDDGNDEHAGSQILEDLHAIAEECSQSSSWQASETAPKEGLVCQDGVEGDAVASVAAGHADDGRARNMPDPRGDEVGKAEVRFEPAIEDEGARSVLGDAGPPNGSFESCPPGHSTVAPPDQSSIVNADAVLEGTVAQVGTEKPGGQPVLPVGDPADGVNVIVQSKQSQEVDGAARHSSGSPHEGSDHTIALKSDPTQASSDSAPGSAAASAGTADGSEGGHSFEGVDAQMAAAQASNSDASADRAPHSPMPAELTRPRESQDIFADYESMDFADVQLSPIATREQAQRESATKPFNRHFSRVSTNRSEFDMEDDTFWEEAFGSEHDSPTRPAAAGVLSSNVDAEDGDFEPLSSSQLNEEAGLPHDRRKSAFKDEGAEDDEEPPPSLPLVPPPGAFMGFSTGANKRLAQPSATAMQQAMKRFADGDGAAENAERDIQRLAAAAASRRAEQQKRDGSKKSAPTPPVKPPAAPPMPIRRQQTPEDEPDDEPEPPPQHIPTSVSFSKASGKSLQLSKAALDDARRRMEQWEAEHSAAEGSRSSHQQPQAPTTTPLARPNPSSTGLQHQEISSPSTVRVPLAAVPVSSSRVNHKLPSPDPTGSNAPASPLKRPLPPLYSTPSRQPSPAPQLRGSIARPDQRASRISLGMTPRAKPPPGSSSKLFKTPFKSSAGQSMVFASPASPAALQSRRYPPSASHLAQSNPLQSTAAQPALFDLRAKGLRQGLRDYGMRPATERRGEPVSDRVLTKILKEPRRAARFAFGQGDQMSTSANALEALHEAGANLVDQEWVNNHWSLILWKLAAYAASKPEESSYWFSFDRVVRQLLYRYEREVNLAQRSAVKRIQERDSSAAQPMVLCVSDVIAEAQDGEGRVPKGCALELTDGWYRVGAKVDAPLRRAIQKGKIGIGAKLAVQGCRLDSYGASATGPLAALSKACLVLAANSTSMAQWDARLGFSQRHFVSTLRSLSGDGGVVTCIEIELTRVFPVGHVDDGSNGGEVRDEEAEAKAQREWDARREDCESRLTNKMADELKPLDALQDLLASYAADRDGDDGGTGSNEYSAADLDLLAADLFEELLTAERPASLLSHHLAKAGHGMLLDKLLEVYSERGEKMRLEARGEMAKELDQLCPRRRVTSFRECRFVDGPAGGATLQRPCRRRGQLKIRDIDKYPEGLIAEGCKYRVTNLAPIKPSTWRGADEDADVFLTTRRETKWTRIA